MSKERSKSWALTRAGLLEEARLCELKGVSKLRKDDLIETLNETEMASKKGVKCRGWSDTTIDRILGEPDKYAPNPHYKSGGPMRLYRLSRVRLAEETDEFKKLQIAKSKRRSADEIRTERFARFQDKYGNWEAAIFDACEFMFNLNRYAKHSTCSNTHRKEIYELKNGFVRLMYHTKYFRQCWRHVATFNRVCRACQRRSPIDDGLGLRDDVDDWDQDDQCGRCDGTGNYTEERSFYCFRFEIMSKTYVWHQPERTVTEFTPEVTSQPEEWQGFVEEKPITIPKSKLAEAKALICWVIDEATPTEDNDETMKSPDT